MEMRESISLATGSLRTNKLRSLLTLLGIIIGIMAVIIIMTIGRALENQVLSSVEDIGASQHVVLITEVPEESDEPADEFSGAFNMPVENTEDMVTLDQLDKLRSHFGDRVIGIDLEASTGGQAVYGEKTADIDVNFSTADTLEVRSTEVQYGRGLTQQDIDTQRPVVVISQEIVDAFFGGDAAAALGERIDITADSTSVFTIVGVTKEKEDSFENFGQPMAYGETFVPLTTSDRITEKIEAVNVFIVQTSGDEQPAAFRDELQNYLDRWYARNEKAQAEVLDMQSGLEEASKIFGVISSVIASIGGISLLVGGIGVMNVMLITVTERTREIGVRKALGATRRDIRTQFIVEAVMVCLLGGIIGVVLGGIIGTLTSGFLGFAGGGSYGPVAFPPIGAVIFSLLFSMAIGVFFGAYPANKAARMQPIDALRYE